MTTPTARNAEPLTEEEEAALGKNSETETIARSQEVVRRLLATLDRERQARADLLARLRTAVDYQTTDRAVSYLRDEMWIVEAQAVERLLSAVAALLADEQQPRGGEQP